MTDRKTVLMKIMKPELSENKKYQDNNLVVIKPASFFSVFIFLFFFWVSYPPAVKAETDIKDSVVAVDGYASVVNDEADKKSNNKEHRVIDKKNSDKKNPLVGSGKFSTGSKLGKSESAGSDYILQLVTGLLVVLLSIVALAWVAKRFNRMQASTGSSLRIVEAVSMGARERVVVVEVEGEKLLLGVSPGRINMLHVLDKAIDKSAREEAGDTVVNAVVGEQATFSQKIAAAMLKEKS